MTDEQKKKYEQILKIKMEISLRCGNGSDGTKTHSLNCNCEELEAKLKDLTQRIED